MKYVFMYLCPSLVVLHILHLGKYVKQDINVVQFLFDMHNTFFTGSSNMPDYKSLKSWIETTNLHVSKEAISNIQLSYIFQNTECLLLKKKFFYLQGYFLLIEMSYEARWKMFSSDRKKLTDADVMCV